MSRTCPSVFPGFLVAFASVLIVALVVPPTRADATAPRQALQALVDRVDGRLVDCAELDAASADPSTVCATSSLTREQFRTRFRRAVRKARNHSAVILDEWSRKDEGPYAALVLLGRQELRQVLYSPENGRLAFMVPESCLAGKYPDALRTYPEDPARPALETLSKQHAEFPEAARVERTGGVVVSDLLIDEQGRVADRCEVFADPRGRGFVQATRTAFESWRYRPPRHDDRPARAIVRVTTTFWLQ